MIERAVVTSAEDAIPPEHLFGEAARIDKGKTNSHAVIDLPFKEAAVTLERGLMQLAFKAADGNRAEAARRPQINRRLLYSELEEHGIA